MRSRKAPARTNRRSRGTPQRIAILGHTGRTAVHRTAARLGKLLRSQGCEVRLDDDLGRKLGAPGAPLPELAAWCQILITLGGDGTALRGARALAGRAGTMLAVNLGGLGFLAMAEEHEVDDAVQAALTEKWEVARRHLLEATVRRRSRAVHRGRAMNDAVVKTAGGYSALHLRITALGHDLGLLVADGVIVASAAGSTAYSLSAGGPVVAPDVEAVLVTPVCPHTLGSRTLVVSGRERIELRVIGSFDPAVLLLDGQEPVALAPGDVVEVELGRESVRLFQNPDRPFGRTLQTKLGWQGSEQRSLR
ncbi:MAG TPA: NAD(+)/NADH kinase [Candidatus Limnocylindria bacterium]|nr:NAD(+)/NADH kinase [Candidatus Limnocylindria bacterium]